MRIRLLAPLLLFALAESGYCAPSPSVCEREGLAKCEAYESAKVNWTAFHNALLANQAEQALALVHPGCVREIMDAFLAPDADLVNFAKLVIDFDVVESPLSFEGSAPKAKGYISAVLILKVDEGKQMFLLTFFQDKDYSWKLCNM
jgi:hypothetical protein